MNPYCFSSLSPKRQLIIYVTLVPDIYMGTTEWEQRQGNKIQEREKRRREGKKKATRKESNIFNSNNSKTRNACVSTSTQAALQDMAEVRTHCMQLLPVRAARDKAVRKLNAGSTAPHKITPWGPKPPVRDPRRASYCSDTWIFWSRSFTAINSELQQMGGESGIRSGFSYQLRQEVDCSLPQLWNGRVGQDLHESTFWFEYNTFPVISRG